MAVRSLKTSSLLSSPADSNSMLAGHSFQDFHHLETVQLGGSAASVTFSNLLQYSGEFRHLQLRITGRGTASEQLRDFIFRFNGDTASNYSVHQLIGYSDGTQKIESGGAANTTYCSAGGFPAGLAAANVFGASVVDILEPFDSSKNKTTRTSSGFMSSTGAFLNLVGLHSGAWRNTGPITSITIQPITVSFAAGSRFSLYGIR